MIVFIKRGPERSLRSAWGLGTISCLRQGPGKLNGDIFVLEYKSINFAEQPRGKQVPEEA